LTRTIEEKVSKLFEHQSEQVEELKNSVQDIDGRYHESSISFSSLKAKREQDNRNSVLTISALKTEKAKLKTRYSDLKKEESRKRRKMSDDHRKEVRCLKDEVHHLKDEVQHSKEEVQRSKDEVQRSKEDHAATKICMQYFLKRCCIQIFDPVILHFVHV